MSFTFDWQREAWEKGMPYKCEFQAGMFQCDNRSLQERYQEHHYEDHSRRMMGWYCEKCGSFYPNKEDELKSLLDDRE